MFYMNCMYLGINVYVYKRTKFLHSTLSVLYGCVHYVFTSLLFSVLHPRSSFLPDTLGCFSASPFTTAGQT